MVPSVAQLAGDFSADPQQIYDRFTGRPYAGNQIPSTMFNAIGHKILAYYPKSNGAYSGGTNYSYVANTTDGWDQESARFDYSISSKDSIFARFTNQTQTTSETDITAAREIIYDSNPKNPAVGRTHIFSARLVNNVRFGWTHTATSEQRADGYNASNAAKGKS